MSRSEYELVARVGKARGLEGEVTVTTAGNLPFCVYPGLLVHVVPPSMYGRRELVVSSVEEGAGSTHRLRFEGVETIDDADALAGRFLLANADDLDGEYLQPLDIGRLVIDERHGELGTIREVIETPGHDVWVIDGAHGEVLVPVVDEVIVEYPDDTRDPIRTTIMDGLLEL